MRRIENILVYVDDASATLSVLDRIVEWVHASQARLTLAGVVEPMGSEVYLYLSTGRHTFTARVNAHDRPDVNRDMDLVFDMSKVHFFDKDTEETII